MIKTLHIVTSVLTAFIVALFFQPDQWVSVSQSAKKEVVPGQQFIVELEIDKGEIEGFAQLMQELPEGFTAEAREIGDAKFSIEGRFVTITWFALPDQPSMIISYAVTVGNATPGVKKLAGNFSYIEKDKTKSVGIDPVEITVNQGYDEQADADAAKPQSAGKTSESADPIEISRNMPGGTASPGGFNVELTVKNKSVHGSGKLVEHIPAGWVVTKGQTSGSLFKVQDSLVKFIWLALPKDTVFKVSYHVVRAKNTAGIDNIYGTFAFDDNGTARSFDYFPSQLSFAGSSEPDVRAEKKETDPVATAIKESVSQPPPKQDRLMAQATSAPAPETGVLYKVQVLASRKDVKENYFDQHFHINESVSQEMHDGWHKYVIGRFNEYKAARNMRISTNEKVKGAFVVAYNNGERITVREALTVSGQKWLQ